MQLAVIAGDFLLFRASVALASLKNKVASMEYYMQKTYYKTTSLISNSCKAIAILTGQTAEVSILAYEYGRNLVDVHHGLIVEISGDLPKGR
ncbi:hypothetical protein IFM89_015870 [Coptis chinensis]|uniref:Uncharacterized protein n=1 Tax=Coptis chinensis TaxID=261450 RepID=A0A835IQI3_9MAGN|nr:hypothetical protein IFM89_015870 [Coptis chinensis]